MNIFFLDKSDFKSAEYLCDKHVPKMLLESCQMLSTAVHQHKENIPWPLPIYRHHPVWKNVDNLYKEAYPNHPMTKWVGLNRGNFKWTLGNAGFIRVIIHLMKLSMRIILVLNLKYKRRYYENVYICSTVFLGV